MKFRIKPSHRVSVMGRTGSGKTTLLKSLLRRWIYETRNWSPYHIVILDTKRDGDFDGLGRKFHHLRDLSKLWDDFRILIYEPAEEESVGGPESEYINGFFRYLRQSREPLLLVIDELASVARGNQVSFEYELLMKQGRSKQQAVWAGIQNPVYVPHDFLANADHYFVFDLLMESDRKKIASIVGDGVMIPPVEQYERDHPGENSEIAEHGFYYFAVGQRRLQFVLNHPPIEFPIPPGYDLRSVIRANGKLPTEGGDTMNWRFVWGVLVLALLMMLAIPLWKILFNWIADRAPITRPLAEYVNRT